MSDRYYSYPINFKELTAGKEIRTSTLPESIAERIHLILVTHFGESRFDEEFGCGIWNYDFEMVNNENFWKERMIKSIIDAIKKNETRLSKLQVKVEIAQEEFTNPGGGDAKRIKNRLDIKISGDLIKTKEGFTYNERLYISPVWVD